MNELIVKDFGPISDVNVKFGDLTLIVGPQASGKSIFLELLKLIIDKDHILSTLEQYNYIINKTPENLLNIYFGEGMKNVWSNKSEICFDGQPIKLDLKTKTSEEQLFYIPAQRILSISDGRPKNFMEFDASTPYVLRYFSETLRLLFQCELGGAGTLFPINIRLKSPLKESFNDTIFHNGCVVIDDSSGQRKMRMKIGDMNLPFMTWSAGQKEFMPLLMGFYCLSGPPTKVLKKETYKYVVVEEPEMGLHPSAIQSVILQLLELIGDGYKIIVSTHSPVFLEFAWAFSILKKENKIKNINQIFGLPDKSSFKKVFSKMADKVVNTYYFSRKEGGVVSTDISALDSGSDNVDISEWGGISQFSSRVTDVVLNSIQ